VIQTVVVDAWKETHGCNLNKPILEIKDEILRRLCAFPNNRDGLSLLMFWISEPNNEKSRRIPAGTFMSILKVVREEP